MYTETVREADEDVRVVNTESRYVEPGEVMDRVTASLEPSDAETVYKKIDSTLRGNLVPEVSATVTETDVTSAVVVPAFPANGRTTVEGLHLVDGTPVAQTEFNEDEADPLETSHIPTIFERRDEAVAHVSLERVEAGLSPLVTEFR